MRGKNASEPWRGASNFLCDILSEAVLSSRKYRCSLEVQTFQVVWDSGAKCQDFAPREFFRRRTELTPFGLASILRSCRHRLVVKSCIDAVHLLERVSSLRRPLLHANVFESRVASSCPPLSRLITFLRVRLARTCRSLRSAPLLLY